MKVQCIKSGVWAEKRDRSIKFFGILLYTRVRKAKGPKKGDILTVIKEYWSEGKLYYMFQEWPNYGSFDSTASEPLEDKYDKVTAKEIKEKASVN